MPRLHRCEKGVIKLGRHKKGLAIDIVQIDDNGRMTITLDSGEDFKCTRQERAVLVNYKSPTYEDDIRHIFNNPNIVGEEFRVVSGGRYVYGKHV